MQIVNGMMLRRAARTNDKIGQARVHYHFSGCESFGEYLGYRDLMLLICSISQLFSLL